MSKSSINYDLIISQLKSELNTDCAISNKYGIVLSSSIKEFTKGKIIPQRLLELITKREEIAQELNLKENQINSFALEASSFYYVFTFSKELILLSKLDLNVNIAKFTPSISVFLNKLSKGTAEDEVMEFSVFDFAKEIGKIETALKNEAANEDQYSIVKDLIKYISK